MLDYPALQRRMIDLDTSVLPTGLCHAPSGCLNLDRDRLPNLNQRLGPISDQGHTKFATKPGGRLRFR